MMIASAVMGGISSSNKAKQQEYMQKMQAFKEKRQVAAKNREIAKANAIKWANNQKIAAAANQTRAEQEFAIRFNFNNETGAFSRNMKAVNDQLVGRLNGRNIRGQTARQIQRQSMETAKTAMVRQRLLTANQLRDAKRSQQQALAKRDFGYNTAITHIPQPIPKANTGAIMGMALGQGIMQAAGGIAMGMKQDAFNAEMLASQETTNQLLSQQLSPAAFVGPPSPNPWG